MFKSLAFYITLLQSKQNPSRVRDGLIANYKNRYLLFTTYTSLRNRSRYISLGRWTASGHTEKEKICSQIISSCMPFLPLSFQRQALFWRLYVARGHIVPHVAVWLSNPEGECLFFYVSAHEPCHRIFQSFTSLLNRHFLFTFFILYFAFSDLTSVKKWSVRQQK